VSVSRRVLAVFVLVFLCTKLLAATAYPTVTPGLQIAFPRDDGSHPQFRTEWWYVTGWLERPSGEPLGFQLTFFRTRPGTQEDNPSRFAAKQVLFAHAAISNPEAGKLLRGERSARAGFGLAFANEVNLDVAIDDWSLRAESERTYRARVVSGEFAIDLRLLATQPPLLNGRDGYSQKGSDPRSASYYYSRPHLQASGRVAIGKDSFAVHGEAWLDHEWSTSFLDDQTVGWDWLGVNLDDGGALMVSRMRGSQMEQRWAFATMRSGANGPTQTFSSADIEWLPGRKWRSPRTGIEYPVEWSVRVGNRTLRLSPLMDDQENDTRNSTGTIYWEGAAHLLDEHNRQLGRGYLELTGYGANLKL